MAFVGERISEADKDKVNMENLWAMIPHAQHPSFWSVDRVRAIYLFDTGAQGGPEVPELYCLDIRGELVLFHASLTGTGNWTVGVELFWKVFDLRIPSSIQMSLEEIEQLIREGLDAYGQLGDRSHAKSVNICFDKGGR